jgi:putative spermidine/putrescine transport system ATP-binding protein
VAELEFQAVHKQFGSTVALRSLDLAVNKGEFVSLLGPSGCGKTTALRIVAGFEQPDGGRLMVRGKDITNVPVNKRDMGMVFQAYSLFPNLTVLDNVSFGLRVRHVQRAEQEKRASALLDLVGLSTMAGRYPHQLSGGQQQRVALARALAIEPSVLLLDEPLSALDAKVRVQLRDEIRRIQTRLGITTLFVTHDQEEALSISDRVVVLSQGQVEQVGVPSEIYGNPSTVFVAQFVGTMNRIEGMVVPATGVVDAQGVRLPANAARDWPHGGHVLLLLRPESIEVEKLDSGVPAPREQLIGEIRTQTFLGPVTRLNISSPVGDLLADVGTARALGFGIGSRVTLSWDPAAPKLLNLSGAAGSNGTASLSMPATQQPVSADQ